MKLFSSLLNEDYFKSLSDRLKDANDEKSLKSAVVNAPFQSPATSVAIGLGIVVLLVESPDKKTLNRVALSNTEQAHGATKTSVKRFSDIKIPMKDENNILVKALHTGDWQQTSDWTDLFTPALTSEEAKFNQAGAGIGCSIVYPISTKAGKGALIFSYFIHPSEITKRHHTFMKKYSRMVTKSLGGTETSTIFSRLNKI